MKRYLSSILIPCLLLQLYGCYSSRDATIDEIKIYEGEHDIKINTIKDEIVINRKTSGLSSMKWEATDSSIVVLQQELVKISGITKVDTNYYSIKYSDIVRAQIEEKDNFATTCLVVGVVGAVIYAIAALLVLDSGGLGVGI